MNSKTITVLTAAALSIGMGFAATSGASAAPALGAMQAAKAVIQKSDVIQVRNLRSYRRCFPTYRWGRKLVRTYYGWRYVPYRYFVGYRCSYSYGHGYGH